MALIRVRNNEDMPRVVELLTPMLEKLGLIMFAWEYEKATYRTLVELEEDQTDLRQAAWVEINITEETCFDIAAKAGAEVGFMCGDYKYVYTRWYKPDGTETYEHDSEWWMED